MGIIYSLRQLRLDGPPEGLGPGFLCSWTATSQKLASGPKHLERLALCWPL